jgi:hypothetical protein
MIQDEKCVMICVTQYKKWAVPFAFFSMALFHLPLRLHKQISFYRLMGTGRSGTFDIYPDLNKWCILSVIEKDEFEKLKDDVSITFFGLFIQKWLQLFCTKVYFIALSPFAGHGTWDGEMPFGAYKEKNYEPTLPIAVLTRATIRLRKMKRFWMHVDGVAKDLLRQPGFMFSLGVGEVPWKKQATLSIWKDVDSVKNFAYKQRAHADVVKKTRAEEWYSEDMFTRFEVLGIYGDAPLNWSAPQYV